MNFEVDKYIHRTVAIIKTNILSIVTVVTKETTVGNVISNRKVSENSLPSIARNKREKKREKKKEDIGAKESTYADVVKKGFAEKKWKILTQ